MESQEQREFMTRKANQYIYNENNTYYLDTYGSSHLKKLFKDWPTYSVSSDINLVDYRRTLTEHLKKREKIEIHNKNK